MWVHCEALPAKHEDAVRGATVTGGAWLHTFGFGLGCASRQVSCFCNGVQELAEMGELSCRRGRLRQAHRPGKVSLLPEGAP